MHIEKDTQMSVSYRRDGNAKGCIVFGEQKAATTTTRRVATEAIVLIKQVRIDDETHSLLNELGEFGWRVMVGQ
jgi:hypothetical protein